MRLDLAAFDTPAHCTVRYSHVQDLHVNYGSEFIQARFMQSVHFPLDFQL